MYQTVDPKLIDDIFPNLDPNLLTLLNNRMDFFYENLEKNDSKIAIDLTRTPDFIKVMLFSEYIAVNLSLNPGIYQDLLNAGDLFRSYSNHTHMDKLTKAIRERLDTPFVKEHLLQFKLYESIRIAWRDLTGAAGLEETLQEMSSLAEACVQFGVDFLYDTFCQRFGTPVDAKGNVQKLIVLGMGKLGARELNFSSDIDLIFVYPRSGATTGETSISNDEFFIKLCRDFLKLFTMGGGINFFRVDTRLRPFGDSGPLVMSARAFEDYYQAQGS